MKLHPREIPARGKSKYLEGEIALAQRDATDARLKLLETQLEPHMLFNTLANLRVLIATDPPRAVDMLDRLNSYLRVTLAGSRALAHPLAAEFQRLGDYLGHLRPCSNAHSPRQAGAWSLWVESRAARPRRADVSCFPQRHGPFD